MTTYLLEGVGEYMIKLFDKYWFQCICVFASSFFSALIGISLSGAVYYCCYALCVIMMSVGCIMLTKRSRKRIMDKNQKESPLSIFYLILFDLLIVVSVIAQEKSVVSQISRCLHMEYVHCAAAVYLSSFFCTLSGTFGLTKRSNYVDVPMVVAMGLLFFAYYFFDIAITKAGV